MEHRQRKRFASTNIVSSAVKSLLDKVELSQTTKFLGNAAKKVVASELIQKQKQSFLQLYPNSKDQYFSGIRQDKGPNSHLKEHIRPLSTALTKIRVSKDAQTSANYFFRRQRGFCSIRTNNSKNSSHYSQGKQTRFFASKNESKFISVLTESQLEEESLEFDKLRMIKQKEAIQQRKRSNFLETVHSDTQTFQKSQTKFMSSIGHKDITYSYKGEIVYLRNKNTNNIRKKKVNTSRIVFRDITDLKDRPFTAQAVVSVAYKSTEGKMRENSLKTEVLDCEDQTQKLFRTTKNTSFEIFR